MHVRYLARLFRQFPLASLRRIPTVLSLRFVGHVDVGERREGHGTAPRSRLHGDGARAWLAGESHTVDGRRRLVFERRQTVDSTDGERHNIRRVCAQVVSSDS